MEFLHTVRSLDISHGGISVYVASLCESLGRRGSTVGIVTAKVPVEATSLLPQSPNASVLGSLDHGARSYSLRTRPLADLVQREDVQLIHNHGVWLPLNHMTSKVAAALSVPLVISTHGMLEPWALRHKWFKKRLAWTAYQFRDLCRATVLHAASVEEAEQLRRLGFSAPITVVPYGVPIPRATSPSTPASDLPRRALFLSRLHPVKGLDVLLDVWARVQPEGWTLTIAGGGSPSYTQHLKQRARSLGLERVAQFVGDVRDAEKERLLREADLFVLPSHSENFGIAVAEALSYGTPVLTTRGAPWSDIVRHDCGWWVESTPTDIEQALVEATSMSHDELASKGRRGYQLVQDEYDSEHLVTHMKQTYEWVLGHRARPGHVWA